MSPEQTRVSGRNSPATGYDEPYTPGRPPATYLATREIVRLTILRSKLRERPRLGCQSTAWSDD